MQYVISFLEGIVTFLSPCLLPMLPIYISYFAGGGERSRGRTLRGVLGFILGFTAVFAAMGALAGTLGGLLNRYQSWVDLVCGTVVALFGLNYLGLLKWNLFRGISRGVSGGSMDFWRALVFGLVFSVGWTPCVGVFLGSALMLASQQGSMLQGMGMLLCYSLGLGVPFLLSGLLIDRLKTAFDWVKGHYTLLNRVCGGLLVLLGLLMATGLMGRLLNILA